MNKKFTVSELAEYAGLPVEQMAKKLFKLAPDVNWKESTPVPDKLAETFMKANDEYKGTEALALAPSEGMALQASLLNYEAAEYALLEAMNEVDIADVITTAISETLTEIDTYESTKAQVWNKYIQSKITNKNARVKANHCKIKELETKLQTGATAEFTKTSNLKTNAKTSKEQAEAFLVSVLNSI